MNMHDFSRNRIFLRMSHTQFFCTELVGVIFWYTTITNSQILGEKQSLWKFNIWWWNYRPKFWLANFMFLFLFINAFFLYFLFWHKTHCIYFSIFLFIKFNAFFLWYLSAKFYHIIMTYSLKMDISKFLIYTFQFYIWGEFNSVKRKKSKETKLWLKELNSVSLPN